MHERLKIVGGYRVQYRKEELSTGIKIRRHFWSSGNWFVKQKIRKKERKKEKTNGCQSEQYYFKNSNFLISKILRTKINLLVYAIRTFSDVQIH